MVKFELNLERILGLPKKMVGKVPSVKAERHEAKQGFQAPQILRYGWGETY